MWAFRNFDTYSFSYSEDDEAMDVDSGATKKTNADDLSEYKLDEYDDAKASSIQDFLPYLCSLLIHFFPFRYGDIQQYQGADLLQR